MEAISLRSALRWFKREFNRVFPVFLFFLIAFTLINLTERLLLERAGIAPFTLLQIALAAGVIAKVLLVIDHLPFIDLFPKQPLICNILWKTIFYWAILFLVRLCIRFVPFLREDDGFHREWADFVQKVDWGLFSTIQGYYLMLFFIFVTARELAFALGPLKLRKLFFGF